VPFIHTKHNATLISVKVKFNLKHVLNTLSMKNNDYVLREEKYSSDSSEETERQLTLLFICEMNVCVLLGQHV